MIAEELRAYGLPLVEDAFDYAMRVRNNFPSERRRLSAQKTNARLWNLKNVVVPVFKGITPAKPFWVETRLYAGGSIIQAFAHCEWVKVVPKGRDENGRPQAIYEPVPEKGAIYEILEPLVTTKTGHDPRDFGKPLVVVREQFKWDPRTDDTRGLGRAHKLYESVVMMYRQISQALDGDPTLERRVILPSALEIKNMLYAGYRAFRDRGCLDNTPTSEIVGAWLAQAGVSMCAYLMIGETIAGIKANQTVRVTAVPSNVQFLGPVPKEVESRAGKDPEVAFLDSKEIETTFGPNASMHGVPSTGPWLTMYQEHLEERYRFPGTRVPVNLIRSLYSEDAEKREDAIRRHDHKVYQIIKAFQDKERRQKAYEKRQEVAEKRLEEKAKADASPFYQQPARICDVLVFTVWREFRKLQYTRQHKTSDRKPGETGVVCDLIGTPSGAVGYRFRTFRQRISYVGNEPGWVTLAEGWLGEYESVRSDEVRTNTSPFFSSRASLGQPAQSVDLSGDIPNLRLKDLTPIAAASVEIPYRWSYERAEVLESTRKYAGGDLWAIVQALNKLRKEPGVVIDITYSLKPEELSERMLPLRERLPRTLGKNYDIPRAQLEKIKRHGGITVTRY